MEYQLIKPINSSYSPLEQVLTNRGIDLDELFHYLNTTEEDNLPFSLIKNIGAAAKMLIKHLNNNGKIYIQVDSDCDGYTSSAVLLNYLHRWVPSIVENKFYYDFHEGKQHGINMDSIPDGTTLVIAPDSSSNDYEIHEELQAKGIDVLVIDHHLAEKESEFACVVNNQLCDYPTKSLSGVGMVYKVCQCLDSLNHID